MQERKLYPGSILQQYVRNYRILALEKKDCPSVQTLFPMGAFELIIHLKTPCEMITAEGKSQKLSFFYTGHFTKPMRLLFTEEAKLLVVSLQPWAGKMLFNIPANKFTDMNVGIDSIEKETTQMLDALHLFCRFSSFLQTQHQAYFQTLYPL